MRQEVSTRQKQDKLPQAQAEEREVQAQQIAKDEPLQKLSFKKSHDTLGNVASSAHA
jgi:hypothetical protein